MENKRKGKWMPRRVISWMLTVIMVVGTFAYGGIPGARDVHAKANEGHDDIYSVHVTSSGTLTPLTELTGKPPALTLSYRQYDHSEEVTSGSFSTSYSWGDYEDKNAVPGKTYTLYVTTSCNGDGDEEIDSNVEIGCHFTDTSNPGSAEIGTRTAGEIGTDSRDDKEWMTFTILYTVGANSFTTKPQGKTLTYNAENQNLISAGSATYGTMQYKIGDNGTWSTTIPTAKNAGTYKVYYRAYYANNDGVTDSFFNSTTDYVTTTIQKANPAIATAPSAKTLTYNGTAQALVNAGTISTTNNANNENKIQYRISKYTPNDSATSGVTGNGTTDWSDTVPSAKAAGAYEVQYRIFDLTTDSTENFYPNKTDGSAIGTVDVTIDKMAVTVTPVADQNKIYGYNDPTFKYTVSSVIPSVDAKNGIFANGELKRATGENVGEYAYNVNELQTANKNNYTVTLSASSDQFEILRKTITAEDVTCSLLDPSVIEEGIYKYIYRFSAIEPEISIVYDGKQVEDYETNNNILKFNRDYVIDGDDTVSEYINEDSNKPYIIRLRGIGNYKGVVNLDWKVIRRSLGTITSSNVTATYDGGDHGITVNLPVNPQTNIEVTYISATDNSVDYTKNWDATKASKTNPTFKDVNVDATNAAAPYYVYWRAHSEEKDDSGQYIYNDQYGVQTVTINKKDVNLVPEAKEKIYDKNKDTDPELTWVDYTEQLVEGDKLEDFAITRADADKAAGQNAGSYAITFPLAELNEQNTNYNITQSAANFVIKPRPVNVSAPDVKKTYSDEVPKYELTIEQAVEGAEEQRGLLEGDTISGNVQYKIGASVYTMDRYTDVGEYTIAQGTLANPNYDITFTTGTITIEPKDITAEDTTVALLYDGERKNAVYSYTGTTIQPEFTLSDKIEGCTDDFVKYGREAEGVAHPDYSVRGMTESATYGVYQITVKGLGNYTGEITGEWAILPYIDEEKVYNGEVQYPEKVAVEDQKYTIKYSKTDPGASPTAASYTETDPIGYKDVNVDSSGKVIPYNIYYGIILDIDEFGPGPDGKAKVVSGVSKFTITPAKVTVTVPGPAISKVYDGNATATFADMEVETGIKSEKIKLTSLHGTYMSGTGEDAVADANVGIRKPIVISANDYATATTVAEGSDIAGKPTNYSVTYTCTNSVGDITLKPVEITANYDANKVYDGTTAVYKTTNGTVSAEDSIVAAYATVTMNPAVEGETFSVENFEAKYADKHAGTDKVINYTGTFAVKDADGKALALSNYGYIPATANNNTLVAFSDTTTVADVIGTGKANITKAPVNFYQDDAGKVDGAMNIKLSVSQKIYDGSNTTAVKAEITALGGDQIESDLTGTYGSKNALVENDQPKAQTITVSGNLSAKENTDTLVSDYADPVYPPLSGTILPRGFNLNMQADDKVYDGKTDAKNVRFNLTEIPNQMSESDAWKAETVLISNLVGTYSDKNVGDDKPLDITANLEITGQDALLSNYYVLTGTGTRIDLTEDLQVTDVTSSITPKAVTVTVDNKSKTYGQSDPALTWTASGIIEGETKDDLGITVSRAAGENAGTYKISTTKSANKNYSVTYKDGTFTINKAAASSTPIASKITTKASEGSGNNGAISGVNDTMEYSTDGGKTWKSVPKGTSIVGGLPAGTVLIRTKATANRNASGAIKVTIAKGGSTPVPYTGEWKKGQWYDVNGGTSYKPKGGWKQDTTGWWYEDSSGWYPKSQWQKIDGYWYYFDSRGYMASSEWINGWWVDKDGAWRYKPRGSWKQNATGWWYEDTSGWYPTSQWQKIDGKWYYFEGTGYMASNTIIDVWTVGADGAWVE